MKKASIAGKITGHPDYRAKFARAVAYLEGRGYAVMSPAVMPMGFDYEDYMSICFTMMWICRGGVAFFLPDWPNSPGAIRERNNAIKTSMTIKDLTWEEIGWQSGPA